MADKKISQLTNASTPLAGTEVLPIVQSSTTVKVATNDLTVKNVRSNATTGILQIAGPAAAATRTMTVPDANFTVARTDAANSFTSDQTLADGNLVVGTAGKGIDFSANTHAAGMSSELLNWYETGTWTPTYVPETGAFGAITYGFNTGQYVRIGALVWVSWSMRTSGITVGTASGAVNIGGLPFSILNATGGPQNALGTGVDFAVNNAAVVSAVPNTSTLLLYQERNNTTIQVTDLSTGGANNFTSGMICYRTV